VGGRGRSKTETAEGEMKTGKGRGKRGGLTYRISARVTGSGGRPLSLEGYTIEEEKKNSVRQGYGRDYEECMRFENTSS